jgi:hypothetical protein
MSVRIVLTRLRLLITSVLREIGRGRPCSFRKRPQALQRTEPNSSRRHSGVVEVLQFWQVGCEDALEAIISKIRRFARVREWKGRGAGEAVESVEDGIDNITIIAILIGGDKTSLAKKKLCPMQKWALIRGGDSAARLIGITSRVRDMIT